MGKVNNVHELDVCDIIQGVHIQNKWWPTGEFLTYGLHMHDMRSHSLGVQLGIHINKYVHLESPMHEIQITLGVALPWISSASILRDACTCISILTQCLAPELCTTATKDHNSVAVGSLQSSLVQYIKTM